MLRALPAFLLLATALVAQDQNEENPAVQEPAPEAKPAIQDLGDGKFQVGLVGFNQQTREISFPAEVNMQDGPLEYAIVHHNGKIHESVLITKARPFHINIALKLLDYKESKELFPILDEDYRPTGKFPKVPEETKNAARAEVLLNWKTEDGKEHKATLNDWVTYTVTGEALPPLAWVYGGSYFHETSFQAEASGDIVALFVSNASLFNWPGEDNNLDDVWLPNTKRIPAVGTPVTVTIKPLLDRQTSADPAGSPPDLDSVLVDPLKTRPAEPKHLPLPEPKAPPRKDQL